MQSRVAQALSRPSAGGSISASGSSPQSTSANYCHAFSAKMHFKKEDTVISFKIHRPVRRALHQMKSSNMKERESLQSHHVSRTERGGHGTCGNSWWSLPVASEVLSYLRSELSAARPCVQDVNAKFSDYTQCSPERQYVSFIR